MAGFIHSTLISPRRDPHFATNNVHGEHAQMRLLWLASSYCKKHRVAVDVGAHIGVWACELARRFKEVWAFEPCRENFDCLRANVREQAHILNVALGDQERMCDMALSEGGNSGMWHIIPGDAVEMHTLNSYTLDEVDLLKIDVEGFEDKVLMGAVETLRLSRPVVVFEGNGIGTKYFGKAWTDPKLLLASEGYVRAKRVNKDEIWVPKC